MTPVERAAGPLVAAYGEALRDPRIPHVGQHAARSVFESIDEEDLAAVIRAAWIGDAPGWAWGDTTDHVRAEWAKVARAVVAHLTKGNENDE